MRFSPPSPLERYRDGRFGMRELAWATLMEWGELEEGTPRWEEAYTVARETMARARQNVETIIAFLRERGYIFGPADEAMGTALPVWQPPTAESNALLTRLNAEVGPLPLSLRAWYEIVGSVSLQGRLPGVWDRTQTLPENDPLMVDPLDYLLQGMDHYRETAEHYRQSDEPELRGDSYYQQPGLPFYIAPDTYHKANVSGGLPYEIRVPDRRADAPLLNVRIFIPAPPGHSLPYQEITVSETFVGYLRRSLQWAGFPGYAFPLQHDFEWLKPLFAEMLPI
jgi:hypothetical protein